MRPRLGVGKTTAYLETVLIGPDGQVLISVEASLELTITENGPGWSGVITLQNADQTPEWIRNAYALQLPLTIRTAPDREGLVIIEALWRRASTPWQARVTGVGTRPFD